MKLNNFFRASAVKFLLCPLLLMIWTTVTAQNDPFTRMKQMADKETAITGQLSKVAITRNTPGWEAISKPAIAFTPFEMKDKTGRNIPPDEIVTAGNGQKMTAKEFFRQLNDLEKSMNLNGYSLRVKDNVTVSKINTPDTYFNGKLNLQPETISAAKSDEDLKTMLFPTQKAGDITLKPYNLYTPAEKSKLNKYAVTEKNNVVSTTPLLKPLPIKIAGNPTGLLRTINETYSKDMNLGSPSTLQVGIKGSLTRFAKIYRFDPQHPETTSSEFKVTANGSVYGALFGHSMNFVTGNAEFYAPADLTKKMNIKAGLNVSGITVFNMNESFDQEKSYIKLLGKNFDKSFSFSVPIIGPLEFTGKFGARGSVGLQFEGNIYRTFVNVVAKPLADLKAYGEASADIAGIAGVGIGGELTIIHGNLDVEGFCGIWIQNANQIVVGANYYLGYNFTALSGRIYAFGRVCIPDWVPIVGGSCSTKEVNIFQSSGYSRSGTLAQDTKTYVISNL